MSKRMRFAVVPFIAGAVVALTTASAWAFTQQMLNPNGNYNFDYGPLDGKAKSGESTNNSDPNKPGFHFGIEGGQQTTSPYGFHSFGGVSPPEPPGSRPLGNGN
jgi:hypothetical protein